MAPPVEARHGAVWDNRFRLIGAPPGATIGALGVDAARYRRASTLPSAVLRTLPAIRQAGAVIAVPHLHPQAGLNVLFSPPVPASRSVAAPIGDARGDATPYVDEV